MQATAAQTQVTPKQLAEQMLAFWHGLMKQSDTTAGLYAIIDELDLSLTQIKTLHALSACDCEVSVKELAERSNMSLPGASRTVEALLRRGYLERREDEVDRRMKRVGITPAGRDVVERLDTARLQGLEQFTAGLSDAQRKRLSSALAECVGDKAWQ